MSEQRRDTFRSVMNFPRGGKHNDEPIEGFEDEVSKFLVG